jgi:hypothetical protein
MDGRGRILSTARHFPKALDGFFAIELAPVG